MLQADDGPGGAVTLIQRFGSTAKLNIRLHGLELDRVNGCDADGAPIFIEASAANDDELHAPVRNIIARLMKMLTRAGVLVEDMGQTCLTEPDRDGDGARTLRPSQAAAVTSHRMAFGLGAGQKVLNLRGAMPRETTARQPLCADIDGFSAARGGPGRRGRPPSRWNSRAATSPDRRCRPSGCRSTPTDRRS